MKKLVLLLVLLCVAFTGCNNADAELSKEDKAFLKKIPDNYIFSVGTGGWGTHLQIKNNGKFIGKYFDKDEANKGEKYENGTVYLCNFSGEFCDLEKIDEYTYTMKVKSIDIEKIKGESYIEGDIKYVSGKPVGMENVDILEIYLPGKPVSELSNEYLLWDKKAKETDKLDHYGIYNSQDNAVFTEVKE